MGNIKGEKMKGKLNVDGCVDEKKDRLAQLKWEGRGVDGL